MSGSKSLLTSKTFWGAMMMLASTAGTYFKVEIGDPSAWVTAITGLAGSVLAIIGRVKAVKRIG